MDTEEKLFTEWKQFKKFRKIGTFSFIGIWCFSLLKALVHRLGTPLLREGFSWIFLPAVIALGIACCISFLVTTTWECPQCGKAYASKFYLVGFTNWPYLNECRHCGLPFGSTKVNTASNPSLQSDGADGSVDSQP
jgi:hypothetical protein